MKCKVVAATYKTGQILNIKYDCKSATSTCLIAKANDEESPYTVLHLDNTSPGFLSDKSSYLKDLRI